MTKENTIQFSYKFIKERYNAGKNYIIFYSEDNDVNGSSNESVRILDVSRSKSTWEFCDGKLSRESPNKSKFPKDLELIINKLPLHVRKIIKVAK